MKWTYSDIDWQRLVRASDKYKLMCLQQEDLDGNKYEAVVLVDPQGHMTMVESDVVKSTEEK